LLDGGIDGVYDRGSLIAIEFNDRIQYTNKIISLLQSKESLDNKLLLLPIELRTEIIEMLVVVVCYDQTCYPGKRKKQIKYKKKINL
jgi:hypothetical protein